MIAPTDNLRVLSLIPGRLRLHLLDRRVGDEVQVEASLRRIPGVESVQVNALTGNLLIRFDSDLISAQALLKEVAAWMKRAEAEPEKPIARHDETRSALMRIGVRGLLGHAVVDSVWFATGYLGQSFGLPLAGLGPLHVLMDITVWTMAVRSRSKAHPSPQRS